MEVIPTIRNTTDSTRLMVINTMAINNEERRNNGIL